MNNNENEPNKVKAIWLIVGISTLLMEFIVALKNFIEFVK